MTQETVAMVEESPKTETKASVVKNHVIKQLQGHGSGERSDQNESNAAMSTRNATIRSPAPNSSARR